MLFRTLISSELLITEFDKLNWLIFLVRIGILLGHGYSLTVEGHSNKDRQYFYLEHCLIIVYWCFLKVSVCWKMLWSNWRNISLKFGLRKCSPNMHSTAKSIFAYLIWTIFAKPSFEIPTWTFETKTLFIWPYDGLIEIFFNILCIMYLCKGT